MTRKEFTELLGLSKQTVVSAYDKSTVRTSPKTIEYIHKKAHELGYYTNKLVGALKSKKLDLVCCLGKVGDYLQFFPKNFQFNLLIGFTHCRSGAYRQMYSCFRFFIFESNFEEYDILELDMPIILINTAPQNIFYQVICEDKALAIKVADMLFKYYNSLNPIQVEIKNLHLSRGTHE